MKRMGIILFASLSLLGQIAWGGSHGAQVSTPALAEEVAELRSDFAALAARFEELAAENAELRAAQEKNQVQAVEIHDAQESLSWAERIQVKGDLRYRYQNGDVDGTLSSGGQGSTRNRQRIRARPTIIAKLPSNIEVGFGLATGSDDPVSTNQTLGNGGSTKGINLDLAYFEWQALEGLYLAGGKFKNALLRVGGNALLWDGDWRPEGVQLRYDTGGMFFANALGTWLESDSRNADEFAYGGQAGLRWSGDAVNFTVGAGYYDIDAAGRECFYDSGDCFGNTVNPDGTYTFDFQEFEVFTEVGFELFGLPAAFFADLVQNTDAKALDTAYAFGLKLGKAKKQGGWEVGYVYQDLEADAVLGLLTDSDFSGGGTDSEGHKLSLKYATTDRTSVKLTYFATEHQDSQGFVNNFQPYDVDTLQLDFGLKVK